MPVLGQGHRVYAIDLIGYGYSDKPNPQNLDTKPFYTFETWASQLNDFCTEIVEDKAFFICNSIGGDHLYHFLTFWHVFHIFVLFLFSVKVIKKIIVCHKWISYYSNCRIGGSPGSSHESCNLQGNYTPEHIPPHVAHKETTLVRKASDKILPKFAKVK